VVSNVKTPAPAQTANILAPRSLQLGAALLMGTLMGATSLAQAQNAPPPPAADDSLTWHGITLSGIVDAGVQYESHGAPISDYFPAGANDIVQPDSMGSVTGITPNNLSQSQINLSGKEPIGGDWSAIFRTSTFFQSNSGDLTDALKSLVLNNGRAAQYQTTGIDSSAAGQLFAGGAYVGVSSPSFGSLTFGRPTTLAADGISKYDPNAASQAFSVLGLSGTPAGGGDTEDRRWDDSVKYTISTNGLHFGAMYKFGGGDNSSAVFNNSIGSGYQFQVGGEFAGFSIDAYYHNFKDAIGVSALSAAQVTGLPALNTTDIPGTTVAECAGCTVGNSLAATISDNTTWFVMASYVAGPVKVSGGYESIQYANPSTPLQQGSVDIGGYLLAYTTNNKFTTDKDLSVYWLGAKWTATPQLDVTAAFYGESQSFYETGAVLTSCSTSAHGNCSGTLAAWSLDAVYHYSKRLDAYAGLMGSSVSDGLAAGYTNTSTIDPTVGFRFKF